MRSRTESNQSNSTFYQSLVVPFEHPVTSLSISPLGTEVVLAAKRGLYILNLESPFDEPKILQHFSKWEVADVIWNPHPNRSNWIASTSNQKALIWDITSGSNNHIKCILTKHLRAVSDIHWSPFHSDILATCSYDSYVHVWDLRLRSDRPAHSFSAWQVGASQVKFNRMNEFILASSHDTDVHVWDIRKGSTPQTLLTAHATKIYGIDWSRRHECELVTCSQDQQVKLWDTKEKQCKTVISTTSPVWRARFTPFGNGIVTMPQRKDNNLYLWNLDYPSVPMHIFSGHSDTPTEFVWR
ncbi:WD40-repeat-containing domain protein, partial [Gorgonomyces haynaldii]